MNKGIAFVVGVSLMNAVAMMIVIPVLRSRRSAASNVCRIMVGWFGIAN